MMFIILFPKMFMFEFGETFACVLRGVSPGVPEGVRSRFYEFS